MNSKMEVISVRENYIDGVKVAHCGIIICKKMVDVNGEETWYFNLPDLDGTTSIIKFHTEDVKKIFFYPEKAMIGFLFISNMEKKSLIMELPVYDYDDDADEFNYFKTTSSQMFPDKSSFVTIIHNQREGKKYVTSNLHRGWEIFKMVFSLGKSRGLDMTEENPEGRSIPTEFKWFRSYLRCYTNFLLMNPSVNERDMKRIIRAIDDLPKFMKMYSGLDLDLLQNLPYGFMRLHTCKNQGCKKFGYLKCPECRNNHYCGKGCQIQDWNHHRDKCQECGGVRVRAFLIPKLIQREIASVHDNELPSFEVFYKVFEALYDSLKTPAFSFMFREHSIFASRDVSLLVKRRGVKSQSWESFQEQFFNAYGKVWDLKPLIVAVLSWL